MPALSMLYRELAQQLQNTIRKKYWDPVKLLFADRSEKDLFSQHTNSLAILTGTIAGSPATALAKKIMTDTALVKASIYFKYYLHRRI